MPKHSTRTEYCHHQANECARAASEAAAGDVKEAYANLEQAWLQLAPEVDERQVPLSRHREPASSIVKTSTRFGYRARRHAG